MPTLWRKEVEPQTRVPRVCSTGLDPFDPPKHRRRINTLALADDALFPSFPPPYRRLLSSKDEAVKLSPSFPIEPTVTLSLRFQPRGKRDFNTFVYARARRANGAYYTPSLLNHNS